jgi:malate dehydrogenase (oxaloacetate-decarboxylating)
MSETTAAFATTALSGYELLADPRFNKGTAFSDIERGTFDLHGLLPPSIATLDEQVSRRLQALRGFETDIERYAFLRGLQDTNETLFYALLVGESGRAAADRLHAHRRRRLSAIQPPVSQAARAVS